ncbi:MAG: hypothetical protein PF484_07430 [Bacteroidales bacterium]|jgi:hypothetical protein|nr:hypothetical protein [Bacteroidales bacterium]
MFNTSLKGNPNPLILYRFALSEFFHSAQKEDWFNNTLFVITADHTSEIPNSTDFSNLVHFKIPIAFYAPNDSILLSTESQR